MSFWLARLPSRRRRGWSSCGDLRLLQIVDEVMGAATFLASRGIARLSTTIARPLGDRVGHLDAVFGFRRARFCACLTSPEKPTAKQISPEASAFKYSDE